MNSSTTPGGSDGRTDRIPYGIDPAVALWADITNGAGLAGLLDLALRDADRDGDSDRDGGADDGDLLGDESGPVRRGSLRHDAAPDLALGGVWARAAAPGGDSRGAAAATLTYVPRHRARLTLLARLAERRAVAVERRETLADLAALGVIL